MANRKISDLTALTAPATGRPYQGGWFAVGLLTCYQSTSTHAIR